MSYSYADLINAYGALGVEKGRTVYVTSDLVYLMAYEKPGKKALLEAHFNALMELLGPDGTLVVSTASTNLCNTDILFDPDRTPVHLVGQLSEYVRTRPEARRSFHPFVSYCAIGPQAEHITANVSRHAYGPETPEARMIELDALSISIGLYPRHTCSTVHHVEQMLAVPYRYTKEFEQPVVRDDKTVTELFYLYVWYRDCGIERSNTKWIFEHLDKASIVKSTPVGAGKIHSYSMPEFVAKVTRLIIDDMYIWCERPPEQRPWRQ
jgi:aminoglycoside 3-N-acetyltransferase